MIPDALITDISYVLREFVFDALEFAALLVVREKRASEDLGDDFRTATGRVCLREYEKSTGFQRGCSNVMADILKTIWPTCANAFKNSHRR